MTTLEPHSRPGRSRPRDDADPLRVGVVGGGIAGVAAATVLAERGQRVHLLEREDFLGGRAGAWTDRLADGTPFEMERGFHAFFRQYHNLRALLRRVDPTLSLLEPLEDYPVLGPNGAVQSFSGLPRRTPWNVLELTRRTPTIGLRDLLRVDGLAALEMLRFDQDRTYPAFDETSAAAYLDSLAFPPAARQMLFDVFSHSFFNPEDEMSAAELLMQFHFYFVGNPEGLIFDVSRRPFSQAIWTPLRRYLEELGADVTTGTTVERVERAGAGWRVATAEGGLDADALVLALDVRGLRRLVAASPDLQDGAWSADVEALETTLPFAVLRLWLDRPTTPGRSAFVGTTGIGLLDNISLYHELEDESRAWAARTGGSVVELHAYGVPAGVDEAEVRADLVRGLHLLYPETRGARTLEERFLWRDDCPAFQRGSYARRPGVDTPFDGIRIAGDFVKLPLPSALMERAATSGFLAANGLLTARGLEPEPIESIPRRGLLAGLPLGRRLRAKAIGLVFSRVHATLQVTVSVRRSVRRSRFTFFSHSDL